ncbi:MAG TPA: DUF2490 domain-containing protein [Chitinophagaceae bacterium]|jgi:hypothetical protein|nr:DUF2490 domain-containing protein [Chitinophagaceae bacterium]
MTKAFFLFLLLLICSAVIGQKSVTTVNQVWTGVFNQTRFSDKWGMWTEAQIRTKEDFFTNFSLGILRAGATYYINDNSKLTAGYAYVHHFPADAHPGIAQPEHRPWQQLQWHTKYSKMRMMQWVRLEERYRRKIINGDELADGYNFNWRVRYNFLLQFPLSKNAFAPGTFSFVLNDEVHVNFGKEIVYNSFDQNRFFVGASYHVNAHDQLQFGYMNLFQQLASGNRYRSLNVPRVFYLHNLDLRSKTR